MIKENKNIIIITSIISLTILELFALYKNIDGSLLSLIVSLIAGLAGYNVGRFNKLFRD